jgi:hypothetical protein
LRKYTNLVVVLITPSPSPSLPHSFALPPVAFYKGGYEADKMDNFTSEELKDLFSFSFEDESCLTHSMLECDCSAGGSTRQPSSAPPRYHGTLDAAKRESAKKKLLGWLHIDPLGEEEASSLASVDKILWQVVCEEVESDVEVAIRDERVEVDAVEEGGENSVNNRTVVFVFARTKSDR